MKRSAFSIFILGIAVFILSAAFPATANSSEVCERFSPCYYPELYREGYLLSAISNTSNLTDREIRWYLRHGHYQSLVKALDRDGDSIADRTHYNVYEFIERMRIVFIAIDAYEKDRHQKTAEEDMPYRTSI